MRSIGKSNDHHGDRLFLTDVEKDMDSQMIDDLKHHDISPDEEKGDYGRFNFKGKSRGKGKRKSKGAGRRPY